MKQFKRFIVMITAIVLATVTNAQAPDPYVTGSKINYVRVWEASVPEISGTALMSRPLEDVKQTTQYFDGLGRTIQVVAKQGSLIKDPNNSNNNIITDLVSSSFYDKAGRQQYQYLPFTANNTNGNTNIDNGLLKTNPFQQQETFMQAQFPGENFYYSKNEFESSPLSRVTKSLASGMSWVGSNKGTEMQYLYNTSTEGIRIWNVDFAAGSIPYSSTIYADGKLSKTVMLDDKGKKVYTYADFEGKTILKKVQDKEAGTGLDENSHTGWLCTYYVYDDLGQLRSTITPKAVKYLETTSWAFASNNVYQELCFWYEFDERGRAIVKHSPGAGQIQLVYDNKDRLVLSQDENQRNRSPKQWSFYLYDNLDRAIVTGLYNNNANRDAMADYVKTLNNGVVTISVYTGSNENVQADNPVAGAAGYCNSCTNTVINSVSYYDEYNYAGVKIFNTSFSFASTSNPNVEATVKSLRIIGFSSGSKTRVIDQNYDDNNPNNDIFLVSTAYYDDKGRTIQGLTDNIKTGVDYATMQYDFSGKTLSVCDKHTMPGTSMTNFETISKYEYDKLDRLTILSKKIGSLDYKKLSEYSYDEFGRVKNKKLSPDYNAGAGIETFKYDYNVRGWLNGINKDYALASTSLNQWDHFFGLYMGYDDRDNKFGTNAGRYDGNLTGIIWKTQGDNMPRRYKYEYDNASRFISASYMQKEKPTDATWNNVKMDFSVTGIVYDENNNLKQMFQKGIIPGNNSPVFIDKLFYEYKQVDNLGDWSNQLRRVFDQTTDLTVVNNGALGDFKDETYGVNAEDYVFDANGNLVKDNNKKIRIGAGNGVVYNFMDKPQKITIENKSVIEFIYDASGIKLGKKVTYTATNSWKITWYMGDFIYEEQVPLTGGADIKLTMILHEEGRIRVYPPNTNARVVQGNNFDLPDNNKGVFEFFIKDNLENTRMVLTEETHSELNNCTMELASLYYEERMFGQVDANGNPVSGSNEVSSTRKDKQTFTPGWTSNTSTSVSRLMQTDKKIGPNIILKVMAGDNVTAKTDYYYTGTPDNSGNFNILSPLVTTLLGALSTTAPTGALHGTAGSITTNISTNPGEFGTFLNNQSNGGNATPQAYMNVLFFDENFNFVPYDNITGLGSYAWRVGDGGDGKYIPLQIRKAPKNGYAFVYLSNESKTAVYFDNLEVTHIRGRITEENAYYPYGLKIKGISAKAFDKGENKYGYQGSFSEEEEETGWDEFDLRMYDAQIGRWTGVDPYDEFASPYLGIGGNPVNFTDPSGGGISAGGWGSIVGAIGGYFLGHHIAKKNGASGFSAVMWGLAGSFVGAGFGYGIGESIDPANGISGSHNQSKSFVGNFIAFYKGLFTFDGSGSNPLGDWNNDYGGYGDGLWTPNIWGEVGVVSPVPEEDIVKTITGKAPVFPKTSIIDFPRVQPPMAPSPVLPPSPPLLPPPPRLPQPPQLPQPLNLNIRFNVMSTSFQNNTNAMNDLQQINNRLRNDPCLRVIIFGNSWGTNPTFTLNSPTRVDGVMTTAQGLINARGLRIQNVLLNQTGGGINPNQVRFGTGRIYLDAIRGLRTRFVFRRIPGCF